MFIKRSIIPHFISLSSILCGFIAIIMASYNEIKFASYMILLGAFFDGLDGKVARMLKITSNFGKEIDSLADLSTFGIAAGYLLYQGSLYKFGTFGILFAAFIPIFSAIRLARFNIKPTKRFFRGLPTTWAGISIAILMGFYQNIFSSLFFLLFTLGLSILMISHLRYYKPSKNLFKLTPKKVILYLSILAFFIINFHLAVLISVFWYISSGIFFTLFKQPDPLETYNIKY